MIYIIYECNEYKEYSSFCIKAMHTDKKFAENLYTELLDEFQVDNVDRWFLNLAIYDPNNNHDLYTNVFRELKVLQCNA